MKKFSAGLIVGVCLGFGLASVLKPDPKDPVIPEIAQEDLMNTELPKMELKPDSKSKKTHRRDLVLEVASSQETPESPKQEDPTEVANVLNIDISEKQIARMEEELPELQKDVSLFRDDKGWIVRYNRQENLLSLTGINDNDFIRFEQIERIKKDPSKRELISRLENIMLQLQR